MNRLVLVLSMACIVGFAKAYAQTDHLIGARRPCPSPDGSLVAFDYHGDIWTVPISGGRPNRITANEAYDYEPVFSPDGRYLAFNSDREGNADVYIIATRGGLERRITFHSAHDRVLGWNTNGDGVLFASHRYERSGGIYEARLKGGLPKPVIHRYSQEAAIEPAGIRLAMSFNANPWWRKHYRGSGGGELWIKDLSHNTWQRLTRTPDDERFPCWSAGGDSLFFVAEIDSIPNLHCRSLATGQVSVLTRLSTFGTRFPRSSRNGIICYESGRRLFALSHPYRESREIIIRPDGGCRGTAVRFVDQSTLSGFALSHRGDKLIVVARGQLIGSPVAEDDELLSPRFLAVGPLRTIDPSWSADDDKLVFSSDRTGAWNIHLLEPERGGQPLLLEETWRDRQLTEKVGSDRQPVFSPDGTSVAFIRNERQLCVCTVSGQDLRILHNGHNMTNLAWSPDRRYIAFSKTTLEWRELGPGT